MRNKLFSSVFVVISLLLTSCAINKISSNYNHTHNINAVRIKNENTEILIYAKKNCIYCIKAKKLLDKKQMKYKVIDISNNKDLHLKLINKTGQHTVPYIFIDNKFIGGFSNLLDLEKEKAL